LKLAAAPSPAGHDKSHSIKLNFSKNNIDITAITPEVGEAKESLSVSLQGREFPSR